MIKNLTFQDNSSNKFWRVIAEDSTLTVIYGRIGTAGRSEVKEYASALEAKTEAKKLIAEKLKKGYKEEKAAAFSEADFWNIIERAKKISNGDTTYQAELVTEMLAGRPLADIVKFGNIFSKLHRKTYRSDWWAAAYIINSGCSDDGFEDFRAWVISRGQKAFEEAVKDPESLVKHVNKNNMGECEAELLIYAALEAYDQKTDKDDFYDVLTYTPMPVIVFDWNEGDDSLKKKFPKLFKKCVALHA